MIYSILAQLVFLLLSAAFAAAGNPSHPEYRVLPPVTRGNLSIFPVVGGPEYATAQLLTLDEGLRSGTVLVAEAGSLQGLVRPGTRIPRQSGAEVNRLVLVNNSDHPLLLLAGEVVTGGKQDRVIGVDRIVPPHSEPIDLSVFCVEPGRWVASSEHFGSMKSQMAQPSVRMPAMAERDQQKVWANVATAAGGMASAAPGAATAIQGTTSYAKVMENPEVEKKVASVAADYDSMLRELRKVGAKGVVVAINGRITWADVFASTDLLEKYWQKLIRSYASESLTNVGAGGQADQKSAQLFLDRLYGNREVTETEPGLFRRTEISGDGYKVFTLTSLLGKSDYTVHLAKMSYGGSDRPGVYPIGLRR
jgi:ARG and Rhodanese-Phosphatase-superfamily-associated Protein domain